MEPDTIQRHPAKAFSQVGQGLDLGTSDRRKGHNGFLVIHVAAMHAAPFCHFMPCTASEGKLYRGPTLIKAENRVRLGSLEVISASFLSAVAVACRD